MEEKTEQTEEELCKYFNKKWKDLNIKGCYSLYDFVLRNKGKYTYIRVLWEKENLKIT